MSPVWLVFAVHALMCTVDGNGPAGAEFLKHVIGDMPKVTRKMDDRIDVEEYIPDDAPRPYHGNEIQLLSKLPVNYGHNAVRDDFGGGGRRVFAQTTFSLTYFSFLFSFVFGIRRTLAEQSGRVSTSVGHANPNRQPRATTARQRHTAKRNRRSFG